MKPTKFIQLTAAHLNQMYKTAQSSYAQQMAPKYLQGPLWKEKEGSLYLFTKNEWVEKTYLVSPHDQEHEKRGEEMLTLAWKYNCEEIIRNSIKNGTSIPNQIGRISRDHSQQDDSPSKILFKRGALGTIELEDLTKADLINLLGDTTTAHVLDYKEKRLALEKNNQSSR